MYPVGSPKAIASPHDNLFYSAIDGVGSLAKMNQNQVETNRSDIEAQPDARPGEVSRRGEGLQRLWTLQAPRSASGTTATTWWTASRGSGSLGRQKDCGRPRKEWQYAADVGVRLCTVTWSTTSYKGHYKRRLYIRRYTVSSQDAACRWEAGYTKQLVSPA